MCAVPVPQPNPRVLLVGSFPPVGGPASAACMAALRRAWAEGDDVVTVSLRAGAADRVARVAGPLAGWRLARVRVAAGRPPRLVLGLDRGQLGLAGSGRSVGPSGDSAAPSGDSPAPSREIAAPSGGSAGPSGRSAAPSGRSATDLLSRATRFGASLATVVGLSVSLTRFEQVTVLVTGPLGLPRPLGRVLWRGVDAVVVEAGDEGAAAAAGVPAGRIKVVEPYQGPSMAPGVSLLGPPEVLPRDLPLVAAGAVGRRLLGRHFLPVRATLVRVARRAERTVLARRA